MNPMNHTLRAHRLTHTMAFVLVLLLIEFLDEFIFGAVGAAWPLIRSELELSYAQVGILLGVPGIISNLIEPALGILGDVGPRRRIVLVGGVVFTLALLLTAASESFAILLLSFILFYPASGAFVSLSQATLMDLDPARHSQNMARWTFAGSAGVVLGPLALAGAAALGLGWRGLFVGFAGLALVLLLLARRYPYPHGSDGAGQAGFLAGVKHALHALKRREVLRWLTLLEFSDLMLDVLLGFLALYFVDVVGATPAQAGLAVAIWSGAGLLSDFLLIPLLERVHDLAYLRVSALIELALFVAFLLMPGFGAKLVALALLGFFNAGWYAILRAQLYSAMPGQSGTTITLGNLFNLAGSLLPLGLGLAAGHFGLGATMWLLLAGPLALLVGIPRRRTAPDPEL